MTRSNDKDIISYMIPFVEELTSAMRAKDEDSESKMIYKFSTLNLLKQDYDPKQAHNDLQSISKLRSWSKVYSVLTHCIRAKRWSYEYSPEKWSTDYIDHIEAILSWMKKRASQHN